MTGWHFRAWVLWPIALLGVGAAIDTAGLFREARFAVHRDPLDMPSTRAAPLAHIVTGQPVLSVFASEADLRDSERGILRHPTRRGRAWERFAYLSFFDKAKLQFATGAGLRVHGGRSRVWSVHKSFGLFFRRRYGSTPDATLFFTGPPGELERVVAHNDIRQDRSRRPWQLVNPLAYEIAARIGAIVPRTRPMRFVLNGEPQGVYVMTEHIGPQFLEARFGHSDFGIEDDANPRRLLRWARNIDVMTIDAVSQTVDLENLTTWAISILFCGTTDVWQGTLARDQRDQNSRWFWINWDMDHSFMDLYRSAPNPWEIDTYRTLLGVRVDARSRILTKLIEQDPAYRRRFAARLTEVLNHRLTPSFLQSRLEHYRLAAGMHGIDDRAFLDIIEDFFEHRPSVLLAQTPSYLRIAPAVPVMVNVPGNRVLTIDGHPTSTPYRGMYFPPTSITIELPVELRERFAGWSVNERPAGTDWRLTLPVTSETSITALFQD